MEAKQIRNIILIFIICIVVYLLGQWNALKNKSTQPIKNNSPAQVSESNNYNKKDLKSTLSQSPDKSHSQANKQIYNQNINPALYPPKYISKNYNQPSSSKNISGAKNISITTPLINANINLSGGNLVKLDLLKYNAKNKNKNNINKFRLLDNQSSLNYQAISGLLSDNIPNPIPFSSQKNTYKLTKDGKKLDIKLNWKNNKLSITKIYEFSPDNYAIKVSYLIKNLSGSNINAKFFGQLNQTNPPHKKSLMSTYTSFIGSVISTPQSHYQKQKFAKIASSPINVSAQGGWAAMIQHYFVTAWVPSQKTKNQFYTHEIQSNHFSDVPIYSAGVAAPSINIAPNQTKTMSMSLFAGPAISSQLDALAPNLGLTVDYGWLWMIGKVLFWILNLFHSVVYNWGWSIILLTILIKFVFLPLSTKSYKSMAKMRVLQPQLKELKKQYGDDKQAFGKASMALYQKEKVNPLGGCLPMLVQIPVFIALYWVLMESVQLRQAPFIFWIHDLSVKDPYFILPVLMGISMFIQQRLNPAPPDPTQAKIMMFLPVFFTFIFLNFPAGLVLYWLVNNCFSILHQRYIINKHA